MDIKSDCDVHMCTFLTDDLLVEVFLFLGPIETAKCASVCSAWRNTCYQSRSLWKHFCEATFGFGGRISEQLDPDGKKTKTSPSSSSTIDWRAIYAYISKQACRARFAELLPVQVKFADDGTSCPGYPAENAVSLEQRDRAWCTNAKVETDVDLVVQCPVPSLVEKFVFRNGGLQYTAPLKQALVFATYPAVIDLEETRYYNGSVGEQWVDQLEGPPPDASDYMRSWQEDNIRQWLQEMADSESREQPTVLPSVPVDHTYANVNVNANGNDFHTQRLQPLAAVRMPPLPRAYHARQERSCRPTVARYIQFKLLSSYNSPERISDNIDVMDLLTYGIPLPELDSFFVANSSSSSSNSNSSSSPVDPSYKRMHAVRVYPYPHLAEPMAPIGGELR